MDDEKITELFFCRSESAIEETDKKYGQRLRFMAANILRNSEDAEEIISDTYLAAWNSIPPARPDSLRAYLYRILRNKAFDRLDYLSAKCRNRDSELIFSELEECIPDRTGSAEQCWEAEQTAEVINRFLLKLDSESRRVFLCRYYYAMTAAETALRCGLSQRRVKYLLSRSRSKLKLELSEEGVIL